MQFPAQILVPAGQETPHIDPSQVAAPLVGTEHAVHDVVPQLAVLAFDTHAPLQA